MNHFYRQEDIDQILSGYDIQKDFYVPGALFKQIAYRNLRLEVKWAYIGLLHLVLTQPHFNNDGNAVLSYDLDMMAVPLAKLMNKNVDKTKVAQYLNELQEANLIETIQDQNLLVNII